MSASLFFALSRGVRRFHDTQKAHLLQMGRLQRGLGSLQYAYYALRHSGVLAASQAAAEGAVDVAALGRRPAGERTASERTSEAEAIIATVAAAGGSPADVRAIREAFALFDSDGDGVLSDEEALRLLDRNANGSESQTQF